MFDLSLLSLHLNWYQIMMVKGLYYRADDFTSDTVHSFNLHEEPE